MIHHYMTMKVSQANPEHCCIVGFLVSGYRLLSMRKEASTKYCRCFKS